MSAIHADADRCVACGLCTLLCSYHQTGGFNPRHALLIIRRAESGEPTAIQFTRNCQAAPVDPCHAMPVPACVDACAYDALTWRTAEGE